MATTNFNYQVALKEGLKSLQQGRLRQAEQSFRYLVDKFPGAEGGYRGLAKVHYEQDDRAGALRILRDGAAALTRSGERSTAIGLLREAAALDPRDLATHRRLAAALAIIGETEAAVGEYARFIGDLHEAGEVERARIEAAYGMGQLSDAPGVERLTQIASGAARAETRAAVERASETPRRAGATGVSGGLHAEAWERAAPPPTDEQLWARPAPRERRESPAPANDPWLGKVPSPSRAGSRQTPRYVDEFAPSASASSSSFSEEISDPALEAAVNESESTEPDGSAAGEGRSESADSTSMREDGDLGQAGLPDSEVEAAAARFLATRDPRAAPPALEAARRYIKDGRTDAASDLLLQLIASGVADHDAQRLLVEVARILGKRDVARVKCQLLVQALLLDGRNDLAAEVEAMAQVD